MAHIYLVFDFASDEEKAQLARHKLETWKQAFRLDKRLMADALSTFGDHKSDSKSALVRGIIVAAKQDAYDSPNKGRLSALKAIAAAALV